MRVCIVGAGALGIFYGVRLARSGADVSFVLRSNFDEAVRNGFRVFENGAEDHLYPIKGYASAAEAGACDLAIVLAKSTANAALKTSLAPFAKSGARLLTLQNGLGNVEAFGEVFGRERVYGGTCFVAATRRAPAQVDVAYRGSIRLADPLGEPRAELLGVAAMFQNAGVPCRAVRSLDEILWRKLVWNIAFSGLCLANNATTDRIIGAPETLAEARALMEDVRAGARVCGVEIPESFIDEQMAATKELGAYAPSALVDARLGRPVELESIFFEPLRRALAGGARVPHLEALCARLTQLRASAALPSANGLS